MMTDRLGEALTHELGIEAVIRASGQDDYLLDPFETIMAAARNWHTLKNPTDEMVDRVLQAIGTPGQALQRGGFRLAIVRGIVALTDTGSTRRHSLG